MESPEQSLPQLTPAQVERQKKRHRFNLLSLYLPIGLMALLITGVIGLLFWLTLFTDTESINQWREFSSATADIVIIMIVLPMMLFIALVPVLAAGWFWYTWQNRRPVESWVQNWLWRTDSFIENSAEKVGTASKKAADLSIQYRASTTRIGRTAEQVFNLIRPSRLRNNDRER